MCGLKSLSWIWIAAVLSTATIGFSSVGSSLYSSVSPWISERSDDSSVCLISIAPHAENTVSPSVLIARPQEERACPVCAPLTEPSLATYMGESLVFRYRCSVGLSLRGGGCHASGLMQRWQLHCSCNSVCVLMHCLW